MVRSYREERRIDQLLKNVNETSDLVRELARVLVDSGTVRTKELTALNRMCLNKSTYSTSSKRDQIDELDIPATAKKELAEQITDETGIVGGLPFEVTVPDEQETAVTECIETLISSSSQNQLDETVQKLSELELPEVQSGTISPIIYYLHPKKYPVINQLSREGMTEFFGYDIPNDLHRYLDAAEAYREVRDEYDFADDFRDLDYFFVWAEQRDSPRLKLSDIGRDNASAYWVNQQNQPEIEYEYIRAKVDDVWHHDLDQLTSGDIIFHNYNDELIGISIVSDHSETYTFQGDEYRRVEVDLHWFDETLPVNEELKTKLGKEELRTNKYSPIDGSRNLTQAYLSTLSETAADFLLDQATVGDIDIEITKIPPEPDDAAEIERQLKRKKQVVFYGPPGTGKTFMAERFAKWWAAQQNVAIPVSERVEMVTFHPSFTYEDFIEGLTVESSPDGALTYEIKDGVLKRIQQAAQRAYDTTKNTDRETPRYILVIDEINRGNLAQIFGETITLLEADKRGTTTVQLAHSDDESFTLPPNLYIIGTMNTADRSIALVDAALRRRFRFMDVVPDIEVLYEEYNIPGRDDVNAILAAEPDPLTVLQALSIRAWKQMNENVLDAPDLGKGKRVGHSYLMDLIDPIAVRDTWRYDILPLLEEYHFGQFDRIKQEIFNGTGDELIDVETERIESFSVQELVDALSTFVGVTIETDFDNMAHTMASSEEVASSTDANKSYPNYPEMIKVAQPVIFDRARKFLGADEMTDVTPEETHRRALRFKSVNDYMPNTLGFVFKPEPEMNGQMSIHISSEDDDNRVSEIIAAHRDQYENEGFAVTDKQTYQIVEQTWPFEDADTRDGKEIVSEFIDSDMYNDAIDAFIDLIRITDEVFRDSEFTEPTIASSEQ